MNKKLGWLKISRGIVYHWLWEDANRLKWWLDLLLMAAYEKKSVYVNTRIVEIQRGQMVASLSFLCQRWNISKPTLLSFLRLLENEGMIERSLYHNISLLTICNYESYQTSDKEELDNPLDNPKGGSGIDNLFDSVNPSESAGNGQSQQKPIDNLFDNLFDNPLDTNKRNKEIYNVDKDNSASVKELELFSELRSNEVWQIEAVCMRFKISHGECIRRIDEFELDCRCRNQAHEDRRDIYNHFTNWLRIQIDKEKQTKHEGVRQESKDKRRGTEVAATSAKDFSTTF